MITNARLSAYLGNPSVWNKTTNEGSTIKSALDFAMTLNAATSNETAYTAELYPSVAAVGAEYGDPAGKYAGFLNAGDPQYAEDAYFLWNQPLAGGEEESAQVAATKTATTGKPQSTSGSTNVKNNSGSVNGVVRLPPEVKLTNHFKKIQGLRMAGMLLSPSVAQTLAEKLSGEKIPDASQVQGMINVLNAISNATEPHSIGFRAIGSQFGVDIAYVIVTHSQLLRKWRTLDLSAIPPFEEEKGPGRDRIARKLLEDAVILRQRKNVRLLMDM
ncbi:hypothetical protein H0H93_008923 [Arthromyces matolae]|nr:hypothetical protein H0H93_008923 [Arthromyces matolae]